MSPDTSKSRPNGQATIRDVAEVAGVSVATVSRVINGSRPVNPDLAERVQQAVANLRYRPNSIARGLSNGSGSHIGVLVPQLSNPYFPEILERLSRLAMEDGHRLLIADGDSSPESEALAAKELLQFVDSLVLISPRMSSQALQELSGSTTPITIVSRQEPGHSAPVVITDNMRSMTRLCGHLNSLGHNKLLYLSGPAESWQDEDRWRGLEAAQDLGMSVERVEGSGLADDGFAAADTVISSGATAVVCFNDWMALGLMNGLAAKGVRCPEDISITGCDDIALAAYSYPRLTTVWIDKRALADAAWACVRSQLHDELPEMLTTIHSELKLRESTAVPRAGEITVTESMAS